jgi:hypothetical protein
MLEELYGKMTEENGYPGSINVTMRVSVMIHATGDA